MKIKNRRENGNKMSQVTSNVFNFKFASLEDIPNIWQKKRAVYIFAGGKLLFHLNFQFQYFIFISS